MDEIIIFNSILRLLILLSLIWILINFILAIYWKFKSRNNSKYKNTVTKRLKNALYGIIFFFLAYIFVFISGILGFGGRNSKIHWGKNVICRGVLVNGKCIGKEVIMYVDPAL